jgi:salicylate hydroxylase
MIDSPFLIAGGGIAGLAACLGLAKVRRNARLFERSAEFQEAGAGLQLSPNAVAALQWLGAWETVAPHAFAPKEIHVRDGVSGAMLQRVRLGRQFEQRFGMPYRVCLRSHLLKGLLDHARASSFISLETERNAALSDSASGALQVDNEIVTGLALIAADGVHSSIRVALHLQDIKRHQSHTLYRKLLPQGSWPSSLDAELVVLWLCPGGHIVHYLVDGGRSLNVVASIEEEASRDAPALRGLHAEATAVLASPGAWLAWPGFSLAPDPRWVSGKTALIGDAAHAMLPYLAQGAAMALEDACVLAQQLELEADVPSALAAYAGLRFPRVAKLQQVAQAQGRIYHMTGAMRLARNAALRLMPEELFLQRLGWIYGWKP